MKNKIITFILFLITIVLLAGVLFFVYAIYNDLFDADVIQSVHTGDTLVAVDEGKEIVQKTQKKSIGETIVDIFTPEPIEEEKTYSAENSIGKYFYEQLNENQKIIYNGLQENKDNLIVGNYKIEFGNKFYNTLSKENGGDILGDDYQSAIEAFTHDNTDLFYLDVSKMFLNMETKKKAFSSSFNVYIAPEDGKTYYAKGFSSANDVKRALRIIEQEEKVVKAKLTGSTYKDIKIIHDYLVENIEYDKDYTSLGSYTLYGALVDKTCVCEGYARTFKYLADMAGIENVIMQGIARNSEGQTENHAWNAVKLGGKWYLIDTTWDDPIIVGRGTVLASTHYKYFLKGTDTFYKDHRLSTKFTDGGKDFSYPEISKTDY